MSKELKPCPFCGSGVELKHLLDESVLGISCTDSGSSCLGSSLLIAITTKREGGLDGAIEAWDKRAK